MLYHDMKNYDKYLIMILTYNLENAISLDSRLIDIFLGQIIFYPFHSTNLRTFDFVPTSG